MNCLRSGIIVTMVFGHKSFEDLIAASLRCLGEDENALEEQLYRKQKDLMELSSIDEFLHFYRPQTSHVLNFIACIEERSCYPTLNFDTIGYTSEHYATTSTIQILSTCQNPVANPPASNMRENIGISIDKLTSRIRMRCNTRLSAEFKLERRREQNREAQRRRREKRMRLGH